MTSSFRYFAQIINCLLLFGVLVTSSLKTCDTMYDINLRNHKAFMTYALSHYTYTYRVENAFDGNNSTLAVTYYDGSNNPVPAQYLDNGYNWVMVELNRDKFQMVASVTLVLRKDYPWGKRLSDIEILVSNKIDNYPTLYTAAAAGKISWNYFVTCGTTGTATGDTTVGCLQNVVNSNYVAVRRNRESGHSMNDYCCFDFAEFKVNLAVQLDQPKISTVPWIENTFILITANPTANCLLPYNMHLEWTQIMLNGSKVRFSGSSTTLTIDNLSKQNAGTYYYTVYNTNGPIFQSNNTELMQVMYASVLQNKSRTLITYENTNTLFTCSASGGYPCPTIISTQFMTSTNNTTQFTKDAYYGKEAESSLEIMASRSMNFQNLTCTLQQPQFPVMKKSNAINVYYSSGSLIIANTNTLLYEGDTFGMNCSTSDFGFPPPKVRISIDHDTNIRTSSYTSLDKYGGESVMTTFTTIATKQLHNKKVTCTFEQSGFPFQSKSLTIQIVYTSALYLVCVVLSCAVALLAITLLVGALLVTMYIRRIKLNGSGKLEKKEFEQRKCSIPNIEKTGYDVGNHNLVNDYENATAVYNEPYEIVTDEHKNDCGDIMRDCFNNLLKVKNCAKI